MSLLDDAPALDQSTPWAPKAALAQPAAVPAAPVKIEAPAAKMTPETHPHYFSAPGAPAQAAAAKPAQPDTQKPAAGDYMSVVRRRESGGNDRASSGVAFGRYQFTPKTWLGVAAAHPELGLKPEDIWNGDKQDQAMQAITADNAHVLTQNGIAASPGNLYMMHFLGAGGGPKFLKAMQDQPGADAAAMFPLEARYNPTIFFQNGQPRSLGQIYASMTKDFGGAPSDGLQTKPVENAGTQIASDAVSDATNDPSLPAGVKWDDAVGKIDASKVDALKPNDQALPPGVKWDPQEAYQQDVQGKSYESEAEKSKGENEKPLSVWEALSPARFFQAREDLGKGVASGLAQDVTGIGELLPNVLGGGKAAEATRALQGVGDPTGQKIGEVGGLLAPLGEGLAGVGASAKALVEEGPKLATMAKGAFSGARGAGLAGAMTPTGESDDEQRAKEKLKQAMIGGTTGAVIGGVIPAIAAGGKWIGREISDVWGGEAKKLSEELRSGVNAETGKALTAEEKTAKLAQIEKVAAKTQAAGDEAETVAHQAKIADAAAKPVSTPEALGEQVHETAVKDMEALKTERTEKSGFDKAVKSDGGAPSVQTSKFIADAKAIEADTKSPELKSAMEQFRKSLTNAPSVKGQPVIKAVSIRQAREILETLNKHIEDASPNAAHRLTEVRDAFLDNLEKTHPQMKTAREAYAKLSRPLDVYERAGALSKTVMEDPYSGASKLDPVKIKAAVTGKTQAGAEALQRLIQKNPAIKESTRNVLQHELYGSGATARTPTAAQLRSFLSNNRMVLEKTGLYDDFTKIKPSLEAVEAAPGRARETQAAIDDLAKTKAEALGSRHDLRTLEIELGNEKNTPKQIVAAADKTVNALRKRGVLSDAQYDKFISDIRDAETKNVDHEHAVTLAKRVAVATAIAAGLLGETGREYVQHRVNIR